MRDLKIRIHDDDKVADVDLWLQSGTVRVSRAQLLNTLFEAFHEHITGHEATLDNITACIQGAITVGSIRVGHQRDGR